MHLNHPEKPGRRILGAPVSVVIFTIALIAIVTVSALVSQQIPTAFKLAASPNLSLSTSTLAFGIVTYNTITQADPFTITNTGNVALVLSYSTSGVNWPVWATVHLASTAPYNQGGTDIAGVSLPAGDILTVYPSLQIGQGSGPAADYGGTTFINGE